MKKQLNIAMIGYGFMGRTHSNAFRQVSQFFDLAHLPALKVICARNAEKAAAFAEQWGYESSETDWRRVVDSPDIDLIDIASPNDTHAEIAIAAAHAGKMVMCEKPLARTAAEAEGMVAAVENAGVLNMVWYNYRRVPAVTLAKQLIDEGKLGRIFHYRAQFLQDWTISKDLPQGGAGLWRLDVNVAGSGVTGDLLAHCIDTAMWLNGGIDRVTAMTETFVKERKHNLTGKVEPVGIDDACAFLAQHQGARQRIPTHTVIGVNKVQASGFNFDAHLTIAWFGRGDIVIAQHAGIAKLVDTDCFHKFSPVGLHRFLPRHLPQVVNHDRNGGDEQHRGDGRASAKVSVGKQLAIKLRANHIRVKLAFEKTRDGMCSNIIATGKVSENIENQCNLARQSEKMFATPAHQQEKTGQTDQQERPSLLKPVR